MFLLGFFAVLWTEQSLLRVLSEAPAEWHLLSVLGQHGDQGGVTNPWLSADASGSSCLLSPTGTVFTGPSIPT